MDTSISKDLSSFSFAHDGMYLVIQGTDPIFLGSTSPETAIKNRMIKDRSRVSVVRVRNRKPIKQKSI